MDGHMTTVTRAYQPRLCRQTPSTILSDEAANRALGLRVYVDGGMTPAKCTAKCFGLGYGYAGVEYSDVS